MYLSCSLALEHHLTDVTLKINPSVALFFAGFRVWGGKGGGEVTFTLQQKFAFLSLKIHGSIGFEFSTNSASIKNFSGLSSQTREEDLVLVTL